MMPRPRAAAADLTTAWQGDNERGDGGRNCRALSVGEDAEDSAPRRRRRRRRRLGDREHPPWWRRLVLLARSQSSRCRPLRLKVEAVQQSRRMDLWSTD